MMAEQLIRKRFSLRKVFVLMMVYCLLFAAWAVYVNLPS